jgi:hypothetical protein
MTEVAERIARIEVKIDNTHEDIQEIKKWESNHLEHHRKYTYFALTTAIGAIVALIMMLL